MRNIDPSIVLRSTREASIIPRFVDIPWEPLQLKSQSPGAMIKVLSHGVGGLSIDPTMPVETWLVHNPPSWFDPYLQYHPCVEEYVRLSGTSPKGYSGGSYCYRPPGVLHGSTGFTTNARYEGGTALYRFAARGVDALLRYPEDCKFPYRNLQTVTDECERWPVAWCETIAFDSLEWQPVDAGPWAGTRVKWLSRNVVSGGGTVLLDLPAGWIGEGSRARGTVEEFVYQGVLHMGGQWFDTWGYACRPVGQAAGEYFAAGGAQLVCFWDDDEIAA